MEPDHESPELRRVHPHIRGNDSWGEGAAARASGSSPHTGERWSNSPNDGSVLGFIPTYGGTMIFDTAPLYAHRVHPHIRGNDELAVRVDCGVWGSSPHTGERFQGGEERARPIGFIPTYGGTI